MCVLQQIRLVDNISISIYTKQLEWWSLVVCRRRRFFFFFIFEIVREKRETRKRERRERGERGTREGRERDGRGGRVRREGKRRKSVRSLNLISIVENNWFPEVVSIKPNGTKAVNYFFKSSDLLDECSFLISSVLVSRELDSNLQPLVSKQPSSNAFFK